MNGDLSTGDGSADTSGPTDPQATELRARLGALAAADAAFDERIARLHREHTAWANEELAKIKALREAIEVRKGLRSGQALHGEDSQAEKVGNRA